MRLEIQLPRQVLDVVNAHVMPEQRERHDERHKLAPVVLNRPKQLGLRCAVEAGVYSIEHGGYFDLDPDIVEMMAEKSIFYVPTFMVYVFHAGERGAPFFRTALMPSPGQR